MRVRFSRIPTSREVGMWDERIGASPFCRLEHQRPTSREVGMWDECVAFL